MRDSHTYKSPDWSPPSEITVADICSRAAGPDHNPNLTRNRDP